jgi:segregation and condensation protein A
MARIQELLAERGRLALSELFEPGLHKSRLVGIFLAALELVRHQRVRAEQTELFGEVWIVPGLDATKPLDISTVDNYEAGGAKQAGGS